jgi:hypothetical protein
VQRPGIIIGGGSAFVLLAAVCVWQHRALPLGGVAPAAETERGGAPVRGATAAHAPRLRAEYTQRRLVLSGLVPDAQVRAAIVRRAESIYGPGQVSDRLETGASAGAPWLSAPFPPDLRAAQHASAQLQDGALLVEGETRTDAAKASLDAGLAAFVAHGIRVDNRLNQSIVEPPR